MLTVDILEAQNRRLREENDELRETVRQMQEDAAERAAEPLPDGVAHLTPLEERALRALLARPGLATKDFIYRALYPREDAVSIKIVDVMVCHLRRKLPPTVIIETLWGRGYTLTEVNKELTGRVQRGALENSGASA